MPNTLFTYSNSEVELLCGGVVGVEQQKMERSHAKHALCSMVPSHELVTIYRLGKSLKFAFFSLGAPIHCAVVADSDTLY